MRRCWIAGPTSWSGRTGKGLGPSCGCSELDGSASLGTSARRCLGRSPELSLAAPPVARTARTAAFLHPAVARKAAGKRSRRPDEPIEEPLPARATAGSASRKARPAGGVSKYSLLILVPPLTADVRQALQLVLKPAKWLRPCVVHVAGRIEPIALIAEGRETIAVDAETFRRTPRLVVPA